MSDKSQLFIDTSQVLRDITIVELQKQNDFLKQLLVNKNNPFYGKKIRIKEHQTIEGFFVEKSGIYYKSITENYSSVLIEEDEGYKIINVRTENIIFKKEDINNLNIV